MSVVLCDCVGLTRRAVDRFKETDNRIVLGLSFWAARGQAKTSMKTKNKTFYLHRFRFQYTKDIVVSHSFATILPDQMTTCEQVEMHVLRVA